MSGDFIFLWRPGEHKQRVRVSGLTVTWQINQVGQLTALLPSKDVARYGFGNDLKGLQVERHHPRLPIFGGEVIDDQPSSSGKTVDLVAQSPVGTLVHRRLPDTFLPLMASGPALIGAAIAATATRRHLPLTDIRVTAHGRPITGESRADDLLAYIQQIASAAGCEWIDGTNEDGTWYIEIGPVVGEDKTHKVHLIENLNCVEVVAPGSLRKLNNNNLAIGDDRPYAAAARIVVTDPASIATYGHREGTIRYTGVTSEAGLDPLASADVARLGIPPIGPSLRMSAMHPLASEIRLGDLIRLNSGAGNREYVYRPTTMTESDQGRILTMTGDARIVDETRGLRWLAA